MKTLVIAALVAIVSIGFAQDTDQRVEGRGMGYGRGAGKGPGGGERMKEMLGIDSATAAKIAKLRDENQKDRIALRAKLETARVEFRAAMRKDPVDEKTAMAKQKEMGSIREQLQTSALEHRFAMEKLLTPEQRRMLREHRGGDRWGDRQGFGRGDRGWRGGDCCGGHLMKHRRGDRRPPMERDDD